MIVFNRIKLILFFILAGFFVACSAPKAEEDIPEASSTSGTTTGGTSTGGTTTPTIPTLDFEVTPSTLQGIVEVDGQNPAYDSSKNTETGLAYEYSSDQAGTGTQSLKIMPGTTITEIKFRLFLKTQALQDAFFDPATTKITFKVFIPSATPGTPPNFFFTVVETTTGWDPDYAGQGGTLPVKGKWTTLSANLKGNRKKTSNPFFIFGLKIDGPNPAIPMSNPLYIDTIRFEK